MLEDEVRTKALLAMLDALVRPGDVVADLGSGTGVLAALALRRGAARVHAVEAGPIIRLARKMASDNGISDRIVFHEGDAATVELPERVDVAVSECLGNFAFGDAMFGALERFAARWVKPPPGGRRGPVEVRLFLQPADARLHWEPEPFWRTPWNGLDLSAFLHAEWNRVPVVAPPPAFLLGAPRQVARFDPYKRPESLEIQASWDLPAGRWLSGVCGWFEVDWAPGVTMSTAPGAPETHWSPLLFPLAFEPEASAGARAAERLDFTLRVDFDAEEIPRYRWEGVIGPPDCPPRLLLRRSSDAPFG
jgi:SAM-dependent methyltransferase